MADEWEAALTAAEEDVAAEVRAVLDEIAEEFAADLDTATELIAARFRVSSIGRMFRDRIPRLMRRLFAVAETAAEDAAATVDADLPDGWDDLPGRYDDDRLPTGLGDYAETTDHLLRAVGDRLAEAAVRALAEGLDAGEDIEGLRVRLRAEFDVEGAQLGETREERIARTEAARAWNTATLAAAQELTGPERPIVKQWQTRRDTRVRDAHDAADGQLRLLDEPFTVAGVQMSAPGDPTAPPELVINCRCVLRLELRPEQTASAPGLPQWLRDAPPGTVDRINAWNGRRTPAQSKPAARAASEIPRQTGGEIVSHADRILDEITASALRPALQAAGVADADGYRLAWDASPIPVLAERNVFPYGAEVTHPEITAAAEHTGGMIALIPAAEDAERLALDGGEEAGELHCTLFYLGDDATLWDEDQRAELIEGVRARAAALDGPVRARLFGVNHWNPQGDDPVWVWAVSDDGDDGPGLQTARHVAVEALEDTHARPDTPRQHSPWVAHVTGVYTAEEWPLAAMADRLGEITFDRIRVAFGGEYTDLPIGPEEEPEMPDQTAAAALPTRGWTTPDDAALAYENQQTGDGRIFAPGAVYWDSSGPWPLQYADEMLMGHEGAELAGAIQHVSRDGDRIPGSGVLYLSQRAGADAVLLLQQGAPLGVSVDLDDVTIELVDNTVSEEEDGLALAASIPALSVLRLEDGGWTLTASSAIGITASGTAITRARSTAQLITGPGGQVTAAAVQQTLHEAGIAWSGPLTAAAGDPDPEEGGVVVHSESSGDYLLRITRARLRGATLVSMPAYAGARIVLDPIEEDGEEETAAAVSAAAPGEDHERVVTYVRSSPVPVGAREVSKALGISMDAARGHLTRAANAGRLVRLAPGMFVGASTLPEGPDVEASAAGEEDELVASLWTAMRDLPPMPAAWFKEPTAEELPPGSEGVHVAGGRIFGWVAQAGVPHAGYPGKNLTIERLASQGLDLSHFLRAKFTLDDGSIVKAGAFTMNAPHHRDGAECETAACQFDDSRTVAGIVTVGMSKGGMWFAGAANPYLSEWDRTVFKGCQPSYHLRQERGRWELRAVLSVPVPGHSSPLLAAAVVERTNLALTAAAALVDAPSALPSGVPSGGVDGPSAPVDNTGPDQHGRPSAAPSGGVDGPSADVLAEALSAALARPDVLDTLAAAVHQHEAAQEERRAEIARLAAGLDTDTETVTAAGDAPKGDN